MKTYFKMYCLKSTFLKHVTEKRTFCSKVLLLLIACISPASIESYACNPVINVQLLQMCICDKQRYSFNRIYKYERSKY